MVQSNLNKYITLDFIVNVAELYNTIYKIIVLLECLNLKNGKIHV